MSVSKIFGGVAYQILQFHFLLNFQFFFSFRKYGSSLIFFIFPILIFRDYMIQVGKQALAIAAYKHCILHNNGQIGMYGPRPKDVMTEMKILNPIHAQETTLQINLQHATEAQLVINRTILQSYKDDFICPYHRYTGNILETTQNTQESKSP